MRRHLVPNFVPFVPKECIDLAVSTLKTSWIGGDGPRVKKFERAIAGIIGNNNVLAVNTGTSALQLALRLAGVRGSEVITTPMTCLATNAAVVMEGATPVWADIDPETGTIDPHDIAKKITKRTKAVMMVHWGGAPAEIDVINRIASSYNIPVIEDAAQALGSRYNGKPIGSHSDFVAFSFQAIKIINTIDGGVLATKKKSDTKRGKLLRWYGIDREERAWDEQNFFWNYPVSEIGYKMQMTDVSAAIGLGQLPFLPELLAHRRKLAKMYESVLSKSTSLKAQRILANAKPNYWMFTIVCNNSRTKQKLWREMNKIGITVEQAHRRNDWYPVFKKNKQDKLPGVDFFDKNHLIIPVGHWVSSRDASRIADVLSNF
ncbi:DegT/DnrJ/EryC1/StrS family aminotransferase [Candidatus Roizmanbacteria bacterium]|nr:DegT/DnrJ/EryC1/StrS family aminotransferase [Candidatus Roizmanbacteria bacterium]